MKACPSCGAEQVSVDAVFCPLCGCHLDLGTREKNGLAIAAIVLGIVGFFFVWLSLFGFISELVGVGVAIPAATKHQKYYEWALALTLVGAVVNLAILLFAHP